MTNTEKTLEAVQEAIRGLTKVERVVKAAAGYVEASNMPLKTPMRPRIIGMAYEELEAAVKALNEEEG